MKNIFKRLLTTLVIFALVFTCFPAFTGSLEADAASKPGMVSTIKLKTSGTSKIKVSWGKVTKNLDGYTIFRNGKAIKHVGKSVTKFTDSGLKANTKYTYYVKAYKKVKQKQWYNKKTGKWQSTKPAKKYRGKSRIAKVKRYGKSSPVKSLKTGKVTGTSSTVTYRGAGLLFHEISKDSIKITLVDDNSEDDSKITVSCDGLPTVTLDIKNNTHTYTGLLPAKIYLFKSSYYFAGKVRDNRVTAVPTGQGYGIMATSSTGKIVVEWSPYTGASNYALHRKHGDEDIVLKEGIFTKYEDKDVKKGETYTYYVEIKDGNNTVKSKEITIKSFQ